MEKYKILVTHPIPETGIELLKKTNKNWEIKINEKKEPLKEDELIEKLSNCDAAITLLSDKITENVISKVIEKQKKEGKHKLKIIANHAVGYNNIDVSAAKKHNILVSNTPGVLTNATAELAFTLMISLTRRISESEKFLIDGKFKGWDPLLLLGEELQYKSIGIVGCGRIGFEFALKCAKFGCKTIYYHNRNQLNEKKEKIINSYFEKSSTNNFIYCKTLKQLLNNSDIVSIHAPLTKETHHLFNKNTLSFMKDNSYLINTSRGPLVNEQDLIDIIKTNKFKGVALDVFEFEPKVNNDLLEFIKNDKDKKNNILIVPHIGSATIKARNMMSTMAANNIAHCLNGKNPPNLV